MNSNKTEWLHVRCSPQERQAVTRLAAERGQNLSETVRHVIRAETQRAGVRGAVKGGDSEKPDD